MIPMVVRDDEIVYIRHVFGLVNVSSGKRSVDERYGGCRMEHGIHKEPLSVHQQQVGGMPKPYHQFSVRGNCFKSVLTDGTGFSGYKPLLSETTNSHNACQRLFFPVIMAVDWRFRN